MSKWFEVSVTVHKVFAVEIEDHETGEDAMNYASDKFMGENIESSEFIEASDIYTPEHIQRLADEILRL